MLLALAELFGSTAAVGWEAFSDVKKPFYTACDHMLGLTCQRLGSIGQTGTTVHRDGRMASADRPSRRSGPRIGEDGNCPTFSQCMNCCSHLDEPRDMVRVTVRQRGRPWRPPDGHDGYGRLRRGPRRREGVNPFPAHLITLSVKSIYETVPTPPRAAGDRSRGPGYMVWIHTIDV